MLVALAEAQTSAGLAVRLIGIRCGARSNRDFPTWIQPREDDRLRPVLLLDVMDTLVVDPFFHAIPEFFGITLEELLSPETSGFLDRVRGGED